MSYIKFALAPTNIVAGIFYIRINKYYLHSTKYL
uniref:Uncharacterized protein n=1 Tax=Arundo donax TaxID=35708 RepID=A0A0A9ECC7_ARUDO